MGLIKYRLIFLVVCLILMSASFWAGYYVRGYAGVGVVVVNNESLAMVRSGHVRVCGNAFTFSKLSAGMNVLFPYDITCESSISLRVMMESGDLLEIEKGYVTPGMVGVVSVLSISDRNIMYTQHESVRWEQGQVLPFASSKNGIEHNSQ